MRTTMGNSTFQRRRKLRRLGGLAAAASLGLGAAAAVGSTASATVVDDDRPKVTERHFDFGKNWTVSGAAQRRLPRLGRGRRRDDAGAVGLPLPDRRGVRPGAGGVLRQRRGRARPARHRRLHDRFCAPGNGKTQWWIVLDDFDSSLVDHVHVDVQQENADGSFTTWAAATPRTTTECAAGARGGPVSGSRRRPGGVPPADDPVPGAAAVPSTACAASSPRGSGVSTCSRPCWSRSPAWLGMWQLARLAGAAGGRGAST